MSLLAFKDKTRQGVLYVLTANKDGKPNPPAPPQRSIAVKQEKNLLAPKSAVGPQPVMLPLSVTAKAVNTAASNLTTGTPQPVIVNNQVCWVIKYILQIIFNRNERLLSYFLSFLVYRALL